MLSCSDNTTPSTFIKTEYGTVTDIDGKIYKTVKIGTQWWMAENLNVERYRNGDSIPHITDHTKWEGGMFNNDAWCYYNNDPAIGAVYGKLYNWDAAEDPRGLAPIGWHIPTDAEWTTLTNYLGGEETGGKMKEKGTKNWFSPNTDATNSSGFSGLPGGIRSSGIYVDFQDIGIEGYWWSSTEGTGQFSSYHLCLELHSAYNFSYSRLVYDKSGVSVRCVKD